MFSYGNSANVVDANAPWIMEYVTEESSSKGTGSNTIKFRPHLVSLPFINRQAIFVVVKIMDYCFYQCQVPT